MNNHIETLVEIIRGLEKEVDFWLTTVETNRGEAFRANAFKSLKTAADSLVSYMALLKHLEDKERREEAGLVG